MRKPLLLAALSVFLGGAVTAAERQQWERDLRNSLPDATPGWQVKGDCAVTCVASYHNWQIYRKDRHHIAVTDPNHYHWVFTDDCTYVFIARCIQTPKEALEAAVKTL